MYNTQTPIDIHCSKLVDWLVQRRHCRKDWGENLATIRRKIRAALGDMPENEDIKQLLIGSKLDYFKSKQIVEILKTTEKDSKNIFGYYSSQRMKDWQDVVYSYEVDYIYLAEIATDLIRETNYEVPGIRRLVSKLVKEKEEAEKERSNLSRRIQQFNSELQKMAQSYGIAGIDVAHELEEESKTLVHVMEDIERMCKNLQLPLTYYRESASSTTKQDANNFLPMLQYIISKGNTTVYEWKFQEKPERIELQVKKTSTAGLSNPSEIELVDDEIDFGEDFASSESSSGFVHVEGSGNGNSNVDETFIQVEEAGPTQEICDFNEKVARGDDAKLLLEFRKSRNQFLNNLHELEAFFLQYISNQSSTDEEKSSSFLSGSSAKMRRFDKNEIEKILNDIRQIAGMLQKEKNKILFQINDSSIFIDNIKDKFSQKKKQISECNIKISMLNDQIKDTEKQTRETELHLKRSIVSAKELQEKVENSLKDLYKGRAINIMGCVS